ncbi:MAG TPA: homoserine O-acetyltransferase [Fimbriimonadaceae bacterium]|nr:homoserine O-acetyltransferase [Fimbriimonadaceae bacterium]
MDPSLFEDNDRQAARPDGRKYAEVGALDCECGQPLPSVTIAYETWGELNADKSNAILVCHALSGDSHAVGWWDRIVGVGKAIDTDKYFVIGSNCLGGCQGSSGPTINHKDGKPWGSRFPLVTIGDMVECQIRLVRSLGIETLLGVCGGSMGGMQALEWSRRGSVRKVWTTGCCKAHTAMQIAFNEIGREAIMRDPKWRGGDYPQDDPPTDGLAIARMVGHLSYLSDASFEHKFARRFQDKEKQDWTLDTEFEVESYLSYQAEKFTKRFDPNSYLVLTRALDYYDCRSLQGSKSEYLFTSFTSDWLYPSYQSRELLAMAQKAGCTAQHFEIDLPYGHDAFLLDAEQQGAAASAFFGAD